MSSFAYESVEISSKDDFEKNAISISRNILKDDIDKLEEIVLTTDINGSLKKRMLREDFEEWVLEQNGLCKTAAKVIKSINTKGNYIIIFNFSYQVIIDNLYGELWHEVTHVKWDVSLDKYLYKQGILSDEIKKTETLFSMTSEYSACFIECIVSRQQQGKPQKLDLDVEIAADKIIEAYRSSLSDGLEIPNSQIDFALAEFNSIIVRQLGYYDAAEEADRFDSIITEGKISGLFGKSVYELCAIIRHTAKETKMGLENQLEGMDLIKNANSLWDLGSSQRSLLYRNLEKYS